MSRGSLWSWMRTWRCCTVVLRTRSSGPAAPRVRCVWTRPRGPVRGPSPSGRVHRWRRRVRPAPSRRRRARVREDVGRDRRNGTFRSAPAMVGTGPVVLRGRAPVGRPSCALCSTQCPLPPGRGPTTSALDRCGAGWPAAAHLGRYVRDIGTWQPFEDDVESWITTRAVAWLNDVPAALDQRPYAGADLVVLRSMAAPKSTLPR